MHDVMTSIKILPNPVKIAKPVKVFHLSNLEILIKKKKRKSGNRNKRIYQVPLRCSFVVSSY